jgi:hypothetical protein
MIVPVMAVRNVVDTLGGLNSMATYLTGYIIQTAL